jgi:hypothetical protein
LIKLYLTNLFLGIWHMVLALVGRYTYSEGDGYVKNVLVVLDCLGNTLTGGDPDETISSRSAKAQDYEQHLYPPSYGWGCRMCSFLAIFQENHCAKALERNKGHRAVIPDDPI